jgi:propionate CoA-transferase
MRLKMQEALSKRGLAPHVYERAEEAHEALGLEAGGSPGIPRAVGQTAEAHMGK